MDAVILAAGEGSRMRPLTSSRPKVMLPLANKPILAHLLEDLIQAGCKRFILVVGYKAERVRQYFGDGSAWGVVVEYCYQKEPSGTADAVGRIETMVGDRFLVVNGDTVFQPGDLAGLMSLTGPGIGLIEVDDTSGLGVVTVEGERVTHIFEKTSRPPTNLANTGAYLFTRQIFEAVKKLELSTRGEYELPGAIEKMIESGVEVQHQTFGSWLTFTYPWDLLLREEELIREKGFEICGTVEPNAVVKGPVSLGEGSTIRSGSYIIGPVIIGQGCDIGPNSYIRPFTSVGDGCHIGAAVEIKHSIIMPNTRIPHLTYVGDSIIGEGCNLGAGTQIANLRFDNENICIGGKDTGRRKLGVIMGDSVGTGINASINTGSVIGSGTVIGPGVLVSGSYEPGSRVFRQPRE